MMLGRMLIEYGAPTLAGLKPGSLFCPRLPEAQLAREMAALRPGLRRRGVWIRRIKTPRAGLVYLWRPRLLDIALSAPGTAAFLRALGYDDLRPDRALDTLFGRMASGGPFPHEVGVFLGYPLADVQGFIAHGGRDCALCGLWKVYGDAASAQRTFARYTACTREALRQFEGGRSLPELTAL